MQRETWDGVRPASVECADWISMGSPVDFLDQMSAILEPSPNLPLFEVTRVGIFVSRPSRSDPGESNQPNRRDPCNATHRVCRTPYLLPESTRPSMSGMRSWGIPHPLSWHVTR